MYFKHGHTAGIIMIDLLKAISKATLITIAGIITGAIIASYPFPSFLLICFAVITLACYE